MELTQQGEESTPGHWEPRESLPACPQRRQAAGPYYPSRVVPRPEQWPSKMAGLHLSRSEAKFCHQGKAVSTHRSKSLP